MLPIADETRVRIGRTMMGTAAVVTCVGLVSIVAFGGWSYLVDQGVYRAGVAALGFGVLAHDAERHRLERDPHDGAQQQVVALKVKLGLARATAQREGAGGVAGLVESLADDTQQAVDAMRVVARGIYPPLLEAEGLGAALQSVQRNSRIPVGVETDGLGRYARYVEETVYFCVLEAIEGATMSGAHGLRIGLTDHGGELGVQIDHDGRAVEEDFAAVADRVDAYGGTTSLEIREGVGTRVTSRIPVREREMEPA